MQRLLSEPMPTAASKVLHVARALELLGLPPEAMGLRRYIRGALVLQALGLPVPAAGTVRDAIEIGNSRMADLRAEDKRLPGLLRVQLSQQDIGSTLDTTAYERVGTSGWKLGGGYFIAVELTNLAQVPIIDYGAELSLRNASMQTPFVCRQAQQWLLAGQTRIVLCPPAVGVPPDPQAHLALIASPLTRVSVHRAFLKLEGPLDPEVGRRAEALIAGSSCADRGTCFVDWLRGMKQYWSVFLPALGLVAGASVAALAWLIASVTRMRTGISGLVVALAAMAGIPVALAIVLALGGKPADFHAPDAIAAALAAAVICAATLRLPAAIAYPILFTVGLLPFAFPVLKDPGGYGVLFVVFKGIPMAVGLVIAMALARLGARPTFGASRISNG